MICVPGGWRKSCPDQYQAPISTHQPPVHPSPPLSPYTPAGGWRWACWATDMGWDNSQLEPQTRSPLSFHWRRWREDKKPLTWVCCKAYTLSEKTSPSGLLHWALFIVQWVSRVVQLTRGRKGTLKLTRTTGLSVMSVKSFLSKLKQNSKIAEGDDNMFIELKPATCFLQMVYMQKLWFTLKCMTLSLHYHSLTHFSMHANAQNVIHPSQKRH